MILEREVGPVGTKVSGVRLKEYRRLMKLAGIELFMYFSEEPKKRKVIFNESIDVAGLGVVYMEYPPPMYFKNFSECRPIMPSQSCYILLRKNWYMFSERYTLDQENAK